ncbi:MAG TPA: pseudouridine synthase, partial [Saprospiraceae bacterium]|nr:pseudouridine synthase [Saprospiraceae bacterium]
DSQGLIFLTNNGDIVNKILRAGNNHEKEYIVTVDKVITDAFIAGMSKGVPMMGTVTKKCKVTKEGIKSFRITLIQGLNRQIRRMCEYFGYDVVKLERVRIMNIRLKGIPPGEWRDLTEEEMQQIYQLTEGSTSEYKTHVATATENNEKKSTFSKFRKRPLIREKENHPFSEITPINEKSQVSTKKNIAEDQTIKSKKNQSKSNKASDTKYSKAPRGKRIGKSRPKVEPKSYSHKGGPGKSHNSSKRQGR